MLHLISGSLDILYVIRENANKGSISLTQLVKEYSEESPGYVIQSWMRGRNTLEFLRQWEVAENPDFDDAACDELIRQARSSSLTITPSLWVKRTQAIGTTVKQRWWCDRIFRNCLGLSPLVRSGNAGYNGKNYWKTMRTGYNLILYDHKINTKGSGENILYVFCNQLFYKKE